MSGVYHKTGGLKVNLPEEFLTGHQGDASRRLRVDTAQTSFFAGKEFRSFKELNIATSATYVIRVVVPINVVLFGLTIDIETGHLRMATRTGGTAGGTFSETLPVIARNTMSERPLPLYTPQAVLTAGGTHTGGTELDVLRLKANNNTNQSSTVGLSAGDERGVGAGTYYYVLQNLSSTDAIAGTLHVRWEERP